VFFGEISNEINNGVLRNAVYFFILCTSGTFDCVYRDFKSQIEVIARNDSRVEESGLSAAFNIVVETVRNGAAPSSLLRGPIKAVSFVISGYINGISGGRLRRSSDILIIHAILDAEENCRW